MEKGKALQEIRIAVCDDVPEMSNIMCGMIRDIMEKKDIIYTMHEFNSGKELLEQVNNIDIVFLDIEMPEMDGIEIGVEIGRLRPDCKIVIASAKENRMKECFRVKALRFLSKPYIEGEVKEAIETYLDESQLGIQTIEVFKDRKSYWIRQRDIMYIATFDNGVEVMAGNALYRKKVSIKELEKKLDTRILYKIHKSYIVNLYYVDSYTDTEVIMKNKIKVPLARRIKKEFELAYMEFDVKYR